MMTDPTGKPASVPATPPAPAAAPAAQAPPAADPTPPPALAPRQDTAPQSLPAAPIPPSSLRFQNPAGKLHELVESARSALYQAKTPAERAQVQDDLCGKLAGDTSLSDMQILEEMNRVRDRLAAPHEGEVRTYASPRTEEVWERILDAFSQSLTRRRPDRP